MTQRARCAAITPYFKEPRHILERCIRSVIKQTYQTDHFLISDGFSQDWIDQSVKRHVKLGVAHDDYGNTPRGIGGLLAVSEHYDAIFFLDADNWIEPNHVELCLGTAIATFGSSMDCDLVIAKRQFRRTDETIMPISDEPDHVDTNCFFFLPGTFHLLSLWVTMPKWLSSRGDRFFNRIIKSRNLNIGVTSSATVNYFTTFASHYTSLGEDPPENAKANIADDYWATVKAKSSRELDIVSRLTGGLIFKTG